VFLVKQKGPVHKTHLKVVAICIVPRRLSECVGTYSRRVAFLKADAGLADESARLATDASAGGVATSAQMYAALVPVDFTKFRGSRKQR